MLKSALRRLKIKIEGGKEGNIIKYKQNLSKIDCVINTNLRCQTILWRHYQLCLRLPRIFHYHPQQTPFQANLTVASLNPVGRKQRSVDDLLLPMFTDQAAKTPEIVLTCPIQVAVSISIPGNFARNNSLLLKTKNNRRLKVNSQHHLQNKLIRHYNKSYPQCTSTGMRDRYVTYCPLSTSRQFHVHPLICCPPIAAVCTVKPLSFLLSFTSSERKVKQKHKYWGRGDIA